MIEQPTFTVREIARAFRVPQGRVKHWIGQGMLKGYLLDGFLDYNVEGKALVEFHEKIPKYQYAVVNLLQSKDAKHLVIHVMKKQSFLSEIWAILSKPGYVKYWIEYLKNPRRSFTTGSIRIVLKEDWEKEYNLKEELQTRHTVLTEYKGRLERRYAPSLSLEKVVEELAELDEAMELHERKCPVLEV